MLPCKSGYLNDITTLPTLPASPSYNKDAIFATYYRNNTPICIKASNITAQLRMAASSCYHTTGIAPKDISAQSLQAGDAMALLCSNVDKDTIQLFGRWYSDAMLQYVHQDAHSIMQQLAQWMFNHGTLTYARKDRCRQK